MSRPEHSYAEIVVIHNHPYADDVTVQITRDTLQRAIQPALDGVLEDLEAGIPMNPLGRSPGGLVWSTIKGAWALGKCYRNVGLAIPWRRLLGLIASALNYRDPVR